jgi:hypothetical protein
MTELSCIHAFERDLSPASALATALGVPVRTVALHRFPDGESLVRSTTEDARPVLYCRLDHPNERLIEALLAADALGGKPVLVAPYLPYMRQDIAFHPDEAVSQRVVSRLLGGAVSALVTVAPHLHRTAALDPLVAPAQAIVIPAADVLAPLLRDEAADRASDQDPVGRSRGRRDPAAGHRPWRTPRRADRRYLFDRDDADRSGTAALRRRRGIGRSDRHPSALRCRRCVPAARRRHPPDPGDRFSRP